MAGYGRDTPRLATMRAFLMESSDVPPNHPSPDAAGRRAPAEARGTLKVPSWRLHFGENLEVERDGEPFRFRTRQQLLLVARLAVEPRETLDRAELASLLWPEADMSDARAYLRRAVMEMRAAGLDLTATDGRLSLEGRPLDSDFLDVATSGILGAGGERLAPGWTSPMLDEVRRLVRARGRKASDGRTGPSSHLDGDHFVLSLLGESLLTHDPRKAMALVAGHRYEFYTKAPEPDLLRFFHRLCDLVPEPSADRIAVMCVMAGISAIQTLYGAANDLYLRAIEDAEALGESALLARAHAMRCGMKVELRDWDEAKAAADRSVAIAAESGDSAGIAFSLAARAAYRWHVGEYDAAAQDYVSAIHHAEPGPHRDIARHNLAFVWGVLGGHLDELPAMPEKIRYEGTHLPGGQNYELFSLGIGHGRYREAARGAAGALSLAADGGMERLIAIGLDNAGIAFAKLGYADESAACIRLGTRLRLLLRHKRSPMEDDALRRHVTTGYFGAATHEWEERWKSSDPGGTAYRVAARLRLAADEPHAGPFPDPTIIIDGTTRG